MSAYNLPSLSVAVVKIAPGNTIPKMMTATAATVVKITFLSCFAITSAYIATAKASTIHFKLSIKDDTSTVNILASFFVCVKDAFLSLLTLTTIP